eukprot:Hpha_TRINITY_DN31997_c0_g1::TRINITY_DN31997_c0_g1_i1::g.22052::m.22052
MLLGVLALGCTGANPEVRAWVSRIRQQTSCSDKGQGGSQRRRGDGEKPDYLIDVDLWNSKDQRKKKDHCIMHNDVDLVDVTKSSPETIAQFSPGAPLTVYLKFFAMENDYVRDCVNGRDECKVYKTCDWDITPPYPSGERELAVCEKGGNQVWVKYTVTTSAPTSAPTSPTRSPTAPTAPPTAPTFSPTVSPTHSPSTSPTASPTISPTVSPTSSPSTSPSVSPTLSPSLSPSLSPTTSLPTLSPSVSPSFPPTTQPTASPTTTPSGSPTRMPLV